MTAVERHIDWDIVKCLVVAGPGFVKDDFKKHLEEEAVRRDLRCACINRPFRGFLGIFCSEKPCQIGKGVGGFYQQGLGFRGHFEERMEAVRRDVRGFRLLVFHMGTWGFFPGGGQTKNLYPSENQKDTPGTPLQISLVWLECSHKEMWVLRDQNTRELFLSQVQSNHATTLPQQAYHSSTGFRV